MALFLVVDDSSFSRKITAKMLENLGHEVIHAGDGEECMAALKDNNPDCVIMDLLMPGKNGEEVLKDLRQAGINIPVIIQTADVQDSVQKSCIASGANGLVTKPFNADKLSAMISEVMKG